MSNNKEQNVANQQENIHMEEQNLQNNFREENKPRIKDLRNTVITKENFVKDAENDVPPLAWNDQQKAYNDAWENNRNQLLDDDI